MIVLIVSILVLCLVLAILVFLEKQKQKQKQQRQLDGLRVLKIGLELITGIQQHRGMSVAWLNGDQSFAVRLTSKRKEIQTTIGKLAPLMQEIPELAPDAGSLNEIRQAWESMTAVLAKLTPEESFAKHTALVRETIHYLGDMGEHLGLLDGEGTPLAKLSNILLLRLPLLMESIGQARALGSGYAAKGHCGAVGRIRLSFLAQHIRECQQEIHLSSAGEHAASERVSALLNVLTEKFIRAEELDIAPESVFQTATDAIESCLGLWQEVAYQTGNVVESRA